jgi:formate hydrogenlyase subunit 4
MTPNPLSFVHVVLALVLAPLLLSVINRTKALFAGRVGPPLLQPYFDLGKLLAKGAVYSRTTSWLFRAGPVVGLAAILMALTLMPFGGARAVWFFTGDLILFAYFLGGARLFTVLAALDTGSSFEGMGASREVWYSALAEPALLLGLAAVARIPGLDTENEPSLPSLTTIHMSLEPIIWGKAGLTLALVALALVIVLLVENCRIPFDDPNTHLELTMVHEVMVLDHGGPDLAYILYGAALKLWLFSALLVGLLVPRTGNPWLDTTLSVVAVFAVAVLVGVLESVLARLRLPRGSQMLVGAVAVSALAFVLSLWVQMEGGQP